MGTKRLRTGQAPPIAVQNGRKRLSSSPESGILAVEGRVRVQSRPNKVTSAMARPKLEVHAGGQWQLPAPYVNIVWAPIAAFVFIEVLVGIFSQSPEVSFAQVANSTSQVWAEAAARLQFFGLFILFLLFSGLVTCKFWFDAIRHFDQKGFRWLFLAFLLCAVTGALIIGSAYKEMLPRSFDYFGGKQFFKDALDRALLNPSVGKQRWGVFWGWSTFSGIFVIVNIAAGLAVPSCIAGGISCLGSKASGDPRQHWILQRERLQTYIYLSSALLVIAVVFLKVWTQYPAFAMTKETANAYNSVTNSYAVLTGMEYTVLLASYALPVSLCLSRQADKIAEKILQESKNENAFTVRDVREREKLLISSQDILKSVIALLLPLITGSFGTLASAVT